MDGPGNVFVGGDFTGTVDFDPGPKTHAVSSGGARVAAGFVLKLNTDGNFKWVSAFVGGDAHVQSMALDGSGNVIAGGRYSFTVDFDPGPRTTTLPTTGAGFVTKLNSSGGLVWARALQGADNCFVYGLAVDTAGSIYATGVFYGTLDFDPGAGTFLRMTAGDGDVFALKLDAAGNFAWAATLGGTGLDVGFGIAVDTTGTVYLAGVAVHGLNLSGTPAAVKCWYAACSADPC